VACPAEMSEVVVSQCIKPSVFHPFRNTSSFLLLLLRWDFWVFGKHRATPTELDSLYQAFEIKGNQTFMRASLWDRIRYWLKALQLLIFVCWVFYPFLFLAIPRGWLRIQASCL